MHVQGMIETYSTYLSSIQAALAQSNGSSGGGGAADSAQARSVAPDTGSDTKPLAVKRDAGLAVRGPPPGANVTAWQMNSAAQQLW